MPPTVTECRNWSGQWTGEDTGYFISNVESPFTPKWGGTHWRSTSDDMPRVADGFDRLAGFGSCLTQAQITNLKN